MTADEPDSVPPQKPTFSIFRVMGAVLAIMFVGLMIVPNGVFQIPLMVVTGWVGFLSRITQDFSPNLRGLAIGAGAFIALNVGILMLTYRMRPHTSWSLSQTFRCTVGSFCILCAGICLVCMGHEISWLNRSSVPWFNWKGGPQAARRTQSKNNLKQIGLACFSYQDAFDQLPIGGTFGQDQRARHSWITALLPYFDQKQLYNQIKLDLPWYAAENRPALSKKLPFLMNPAEGFVLIDGYAPAHYSANDRVFTVNKSMALSEISDGTSLTVFAGEAKGHFRPWGDVVNWRNMDLGINKSPDGFGGPFDGGCHFLMGDGSVRFISENVAPEVLKALATPQGNDRVGEF